MEQDDEIQDYVRFKTSQLMSLVAYRKLKAAIASRESEERGKSKVFSCALLGLVVLTVCAVLVGVWTRRYAGYLFVGGFFIWIGYVVALMRRHLGTHAGESRDT